MDNTDQHFVVGDGHERWRFAFSFLSYLATFDFLRRGKFGQFC